MKKLTNRSPKKIATPMTVKETYDYLNRQGKLDILKKHFDLEIEL